MQICASKNNFCEYLKNTIFNIENTMGTYNFTLTTEAGVVTTYY